MTRCTWLVLLGWLAAGPAMAGQAALDRLFDQAVARYDPPGLAVGVIEHGQVAWVRSSGRLQADRAAPVDDASLFKIASNTKAMTTAVLARLVDQGKLHWDDPVTRYLPGFCMNDPWVTRNIQVRDLLIHTSGLGPGAGDLMLWPEPNGFTRADIVAGLAYLKPAYSFRAHYAYDNLLYVVAGEVAAAAGGRPYAQLVREEVFAPLHMDRCQVGAWDARAVGNVAQPHMRQDGRNVPVRLDGGQVADTPSAAAGGVRCGVQDMLRWMRAWLVPDSAPGWLSAQQRQAAWTLATPMPISPVMRDWDGTHLYGYGYGWRLSDVDGQWKVAHTGTLMGMYSALVLLPDLQSGFVILTNGDGEQLRTTLGQALLKYFTRPAQAAALDVDHYAADLAHRRGAQTPAASRAPDTSARVPVPAHGPVADALAGAWSDPWFGQVDICPRAGTLHFASRKSPLLSGTVMAVGTRVLVDWDDASVDAEPWLQATRDAQGQRTLALAAIDPDADISDDYQDLHLVRTGECDGH